MTELSSPLAPVFFRLLLPLSFAGIGAAAPIGLAIGGQLSVGLALCAAMLFALGALVLHLWARSLKRVFLAGDRLLIRDQYRSVEVALIDVVDVRESLSNEQKTITVEFRVPTEFGKTVTFLPRRQFAGGRIAWTVTDQLGGSPTTDELRVAVANAQGVAPPPSQVGEMARKRLAFMGWITLAVIVLVGVLLLGLLAAGLLMRG